LLWIFSTRSREIEEILFSRNERDAARAQSTASCSSTIKQNRCLKYISSLQERERSEEVLIQRKSRLAVKTLNLLHVEKEPCSLAKTFLHQHHHYFCATPLRRRVSSVYSANASIRRRNSRRIDDGGGLPPGFRFLLRVRVPACDARLRVTREQYLVQRIISTTPFIHKRCRNGWNGENVWLLLDASAAGRLRTLQPSHEGFRGCLSALLKLSIDAGDFCHHYVAISVKTGLLAQRARPARCSGSPAGNLARKLERAVA